MVALRRRGERGRRVRRVAVAHRAIQRHSKECRPHRVTLHAAASHTRSVTRRANEVAHPGRGTIYFVVVVVGVVVVVEELGLVVVVVGVVKMCLSFKAPIGCATR